ncbi:MAG: hypothetical protein KAJ51_01085, partial [Thermoplasmata archaeon]|nr:hypothetical protein [Thermoplasmata archaeon]
YGQSPYPASITPARNPYSQPQVVPQPRQQQAPPPIPPPQQQPRPRQQVPAIVTPPMPGTPPPSVTPPGVVKPSGGICSQCNSNSLQFFDNGLGKCNYCGRTFEWLQPQSAADQLPTEENLIPAEENPFMATEEEKLSVSERKAEVEPEEIFHDPMSPRVGEKEKSKKSEKEPPSDEELTDEQRLRMLEDRFLNGQISEEIYKKLRSKFTTKILKSLEDKLVKGDITENEYSDKKSELD